MGDPREVILTYEQKPKEVVLTYRPEPDISLLTKEDLWEAVEQFSSLDDRRRRRGRRLLVLLLLLVGVTTALLCLGLFTQSGKTNGDAPALRETTIAAYPPKNDFSLVLSETHGESLSAGDVYTKVNPSVVAVVTEVGNQSSVGTGVILSEDGYCVTNYHVVQGGSSCDVLLSSGYWVPALLVGYDAETDLAVLKLDLDQTTLPAAELFTSDLVAVGDPVYAIGNPLGLELRGTLTDGIISAINRDVDVDGVTMTLIQTNAALNSGNSGGPLINEYGQVIGINTVKMVSNEEQGAVEGLGFAIPSTKVAHIVNCIIESGEVTPEPELGIVVMGSAVLPDGTSGVFVIDVTEAAKEAGMEPEDIIVKMDGEKVENSNQIIMIRRRHKAGDSIPVTVYRNGSYVDVLLPLTVPEKE